MAFGKFAYVRSAGARGNARTCGEIEQLCCCFLVVVIADGGAGTTTRVLTPRAVRQIPKRCWFAFSLGASIADITANCLLSFVATMVSVRVRQAGWADCFHEEACSVCGAATFCSGASARVRNGVDKLDRVDLARDDYNAGRERAVLRRRFFQFDDEPLRPHRKRDLASVHLNANSDVFEA